MKEQTTEERIKNLEQVVLALHTLVYLTIPNVEDLRAQSAIIKQIDLVDKLLHKCQL